jgi:thiosulfate reductase cytochrome b subunit
MAKDKESEQTIIALMGRDIKEIRHDVSDMQENIHENYITRIEFDPVQKIIYGIVGVVLLTVLSALVALVVVK